MKPAIHLISETEFNAAQSIYKIINHEHNNTFGYFEINKQKYYIGWPSSTLIEIEFLHIQKHNYLLVGIDLQVVAISLTDDRILFSLGLFSYLKYLEEKDDLSFIIHTELDDIIINKKGFSISQIISHNLKF